MKPSPVPELRNRLAELGLGAYLVPSTDPHQSEYVPDFWRRRAFVTGFTGSAGDAVITADWAGLWTDSRYFIQAERELAGTPFALMKIGEPDVPSIEDWLTGNLKAGDSVGVDPELLSHDAYQKMSEALEAAGITLRPVRPNLVDEIWRERPPAPHAKVEIHAEKVAGESVAGKLERLRQAMRKAGVEYQVLTMLDEIAWLFNIRGGDVEYNPVVIAYAIVGLDGASLYLDPGKLSPPIMRHLAPHAALRDYPAFEQGLRDLASRRAPVWLNPSSASRWIMNLLSQGARVVPRRSLVLEMKAVKNGAEIEGMENAQARDGVTMARFLHWLEKSVPKGGITEVGAAQKLLDLKMEADHFRGLSFETIAAYGEHGAIVHYAATAETDVEIKPRGIFLVDAGGQYLDGTTDITRTVSLGRPTTEEKEMFTRVLLGHIRLARLRFPRGTAGRQLDAVARTPLWEAGLNFGHGVGHGVGAYLNVHEGPQAISSTRCTGQPLLPGMVVSIEPGYYKTGSYGIRIENLAVVMEDPETRESDLPFYQFGILTACPIDRKLIKPSLLATEDLAWLNGYHGWVRDILSPHLDAGDCRWLEKACATIG